MIQIFATFSGCVCSIKDSNFTITFFQPRNSTRLNIKFMFSKKATKIDEIFTVDLTLCNKCQIVGEDFVKFCLLRKHELYLSKREPNRQALAGVIKKGELLLLIGHHLISWHKLYKTTKRTHFNQLITLLISVTCFCKHYICFIPFFIHFSSFTYMVHQSFKV